MKTGLRKPERTKTFAKKGEVTLVHKPRAFTQHKEMKRERGKKGGERARDKEKRGERKCW